MPYDSSGHFTRIHNWENDRINDIDIVTDNHDEEDDNFAQGLSLAFLRDGRAPMEADLNAGNFKVKNLAAGTDNNDAVNKSQLDAAKTSLAADIKNNANDLSLIGDIKMSLQSANHANWLLCNGQAVSRTAYADLFALIGTNFGAGDGITTFNVPDYRGKFIRGLGGDSAADFYTTQEEGLPNITGKFPGGNSQSSQVSGAFATDGADLIFDGGTDSNKNFGIRTFDASRCSSIYGNSSHVTPINQAVNFFIKAKEEA